MNAKNATTPHTDPAKGAARFLKNISSADFAALGAEDFAFVRPISGDALVELMPDVTSAPASGIYQMLVAADGTPILVTDDPHAIADWLADSEVIRVPWH